MGSHHVHVLCLFRRGQHFGNPRVQVRERRALGAVKRIVSRLAQELDAPLMASGETFGRTQRKREARAGEVRELEYLGAVRAAANVVVVGLFEDPG